MTGVLTAHNALLAARAPHDALCRFYRQARLGCRRQGAVAGNATQRCDTSATCQAAPLDSRENAILPCCSTCGALGLSGEPTAWQCRLPSRAGTFPFNIVTGDGIFLGTCNVQVTSSIARVSACELGPGWALTEARVYLSSTAPTTCQPEGWPDEARRAFAMGRPGRTGRVRVSATSLRPSRQSTQFVSLQLTVLKQ